MNFRSIVILMFGCWAIWAVAYLTSPVDADMNNRYLGLTKAAPEMRKLVPIVEDNIAIFEKLDLGLVDVPISYLRLAAQEVSEIIPKLSGPALDIQPGAMPNFSERSKDVKATKAKPRRKKTSRRSSVRKRRVASTKRRKNARKSRKRRSKRRVSSRRSMVLPIRNPRRNRFAVPVRNPRKRTNIALLYRVGSYSPGLQKALMRPK